jgi:hypothetical protein
MEMVRLYDLHKQMESDGFAAFMTAFMLTWGTIIGRVVSQCIS